MLMHKLLESSQKINYLRVYGDLSEKEQEEATDISSKITSTIKKMEGNNE